jgi:hypothetical protein
LRLAAHWAAHWWFWIAAAAAAALALASSGPYRSIVLKVRRAAVRRGLVELPPGRALQSRDQGFWSNLSWVGFPAGAWVALSPWIWGYDGVDGAVTTDVITGAAVIAVAAAGIVFPAFWALNALAGLWLVTAPWIVGYGDTHGPVGLSDTIVGLLITTVAIATLAAAERQITQGGAGPIGRITPRGRASE